MKVSVLRLRNWIPILALILVCGSTWGQTREVRVCVLNDSKAPVDDALTRELLHYASNEFQRNVDISFREVERHSYPLDVFKDEALQMQSIRKTCARGEIALIFSNQVISAADWYNRVQGVAASSRQKGQLLGLGNNGGFAMITSIPYSLRSRDSNGRPKIYGALKHELGHLFFQGHLEDAQSFLYKYGNGGNQWTPRTRRVIDENRDTRWLLRRDTHASK